MDRREYDKRIKELSAQIEVLSTERTSLIRKFKSECKHPDNKLFMEKNHYEDEYGRDQPSWSDWHYWCDRCGTRLYRVKKQFETMKDLKEALTKEAHK